jgi:DNA polymerase V
MDRYKHLYWVGANKNLGQLANQKAKSKKVTSKVVDLSNIDTCQTTLAETEIGDVWGIGRRWAARLQMQGIHTAQDFVRMDRWLVRNMMGVVGLRTAEELNGTSCLNLEKLTPNKQSLCISRSFEKTIRAYAELEKHIHYFTNRVDKKLRRSGLITSAISIFVQGNLFRKELRNIQIT